jgi:hypothetical protein
MAKSIADFVEGKIRRTESNDRMSFARGGSPDAALGACEGVLHGPAGSVSLYESGLILADGSAVPWDRISAARVAGALLELELEDGSVKPIAGSPIGAEILHATVRWVGNAILRKKIA